MKTNDFSFWLMPSASDRERLQEMIDHLCSQYDAPSFEPHVTLHVAESSNDEVKEVLTSMKYDGNPIVLKVEGVRWSSVFTKTLFVEMTNSEELVALANSTRRRCKKPSAYQLKPHLSLLYKSMPTEQLSMVAPSLHFDKLAIEFDEVKGIYTPGPVETPEDVRIWKDVANFRFGETN